jgi:rhodanese-related sulfurtransferase
MGELDPALNYAVCCVSGYRSMIASSLLKQHGFGHIYNVAGGTNALRLKQPELLSAL